MAAISDALYNASANLVQMRGQNANAGPVITGAYNTEYFRSPSGMDPKSVWSTWTRSGSDRNPADYPCALGNGACPGDGPQTCGRSLKMRDNSQYNIITESADGTGYLTTNWLPPTATHAVQIGFCRVSRKVLPDQPRISQLYIDDKPALHYFQGGPFLFKTEQTPFIYMVPNAIMARVSGLSFRINNFTADQVGDSCWDCL